MSMYFFSADKDFFKTGIGMMMSLALLKGAVKRPDFLIAGIVMNMFLQLAYQVTI